MRWCTIRFRDMSLLFLQTNIIGGQALFNHQKLNPNRWSISEPSEYTRCIGCQHRGCFWSSSSALTAWRVPEMMSLKNACVQWYTTNHEMVKDSERRWKTVKDGERRWKTVKDGEIPKSSQETVRCLTYTIPLFPDAPKTRFCPQWYVYDVPHFPPWIATTPASTASFCWTKIARLQSCIVGGRVGDSNLRPLGPLGIEIDPIPPTSPNFHAKIVFLGLDLHPLDIDPQPNISNFSCKTVKTCVHPPLTRLTEI